MASRQEKRNEEVKNLILSTAKDIISEEGINSLSVRKIANKIDYSPSIIYHYFKNKDDLLQYIWKENYMQILSIIKDASTNSESNIEEKIINTFKAYINFALENSELYKNFLLNDDIEVINKTSLLKKGDGKERKSLSVLCFQINEGKKQDLFKKDMDDELTAQILWTSTFGLIIRIIKEKNIPKEQQERLINHHFKILFQGIKK